MRVIGEHILFGEGKDHVAALAGVPKMLSFGRMETPEAIYHGVSGSFLSMRTSPRVCRLQYSLQQFFGAFVARIVGAELATEGAGEDGFFHSINIFYDLLNTCFY